MRKGPIIVALCIAVASLLVGITVFSSTMRYQWSSIKGQKDSRPSEPQPVAVASSQSTEQERRKAAEQAALEQPRSRQEAQLAQAEAPSPAPRPRPPPSPVTASKAPPDDLKMLAELAEQRCRDKLRQLGIISTSGPCPDVGDVVENLAKGTYLFNKPTVASVGDAFPIRLVLQTKDTQPVSLAGMPGEVQRREQWPFAQSLEATLTGDDFEIVPAVPQPRTATFTHPVEWEWKVKPTAAGTKTLTIEVAAFISIGADKHRVQITTLHEPIEIQVTMYQRLKAIAADASGLLVAAAAVVTPLGALFAFVPQFRKFVKREFLTRTSRRRRRPAQSPPALPP